MYFSKKITGSSSISLNYTRKSNLAYTTYMYLKDSHFLPDKTRSSAVVTDSRLTGYQNPCIFKMAILEVSAGGSSQSPSPQKNYNSLITTSTTFFVEFAIFVDSKSSKQDDRDTE